MSTERDRIADVYSGYANGGASTRWSPENAGYRTLVIERHTLFSEAIKAAVAGRVAPSVLDLGCGTGSDLGLIHASLPAGSKLIGVELRFDALHQAVDEFTDSSGLVNGDATRLPFPDACFDLVVLATVLSSILDESIRVAVAAESR